MNFLLEQADLTNDEGILRFYLAAIRYRELHKDDSEIVARFVFDTTFDASKYNKIDEDVKRLRFEFGALEAPGRSEADFSDDEYVDSLWARLKGLVENSFNEKRTV